MENGGGWGTGVVAQKEKLSRGCKGKEDISIGEKRERQREIYSVREIEWRKRGGE